MWVTSYPWGHRPEQRRRHAVLPLSLGPIGYTGSTMTDQPTTGGLPRALERVLAEAAVDQGFREALLADRLAAVTARGLELSETERAALQSVPEAQLRSLIDVLAKQVALVQDEPPAPPQPQGNRPDRPEEMVQCTGIRPEAPAIRGTRPGRIILAAAAGTVALGVGGAMLLSAGSRPEPPPVTEPVTAPQATRQAQDAADAGPEQDAAGDSEQKKPES
jgi:hypothetical protein